MDNGRIELTHWNIATVYNYESSIEVKLKMVNVVQKTSLTAYKFSFYEEVQDTYIKLYILYLHDGRKYYIDYASYRKLLKTAREQNIEIKVLDE